ncbi:MAG: nitrile hydratase accessory protein [Alphaproteobacteria bacterium]|nr:nitrile hydratase accessory protein [Alphaproteobacteria bacterium]
MSVVSDPRATLAEIAAQCGAGFPTPTRNDDQGVFEQPWQATAFALTVALHQKGLFSWPDWAAALSRRIAIDANDDGRRYYDHWLAALEEMIERRHLGSAQELVQLRLAWEEAAERTPHGQPIEL